MGLGSWGSVNLIPTLGFGIGAAVSEGTPTETYTARPRGVVFSTDKRGQVWGGRDREIVWSTEDR